MLKELMMENFLENYWHDIRNTVKLEPFRTAVDKLIEFLPYRTFKIKSELSEITKSSCAHMEDDAIAYMLAEFDIPEAIKAEIAKIYTMNFGNYKEFPSFENIYVHGGYKHNRRCNIFQNEW